MEEEIIITPRNNFNVIGHEAAEQLFLEAHNSGQLHHAWLITGPKGVGKATIAYKMARFLLNNPPDDPAEMGLFGETVQSTPPEVLDTNPKSDANQFITAGSHGDIIAVERLPDEKTGKMRKEITIDSIRNLQGFFSKTSTFGGWRVAIIDSADELNRNAANAILKILEEPPKNSIIILVSHAPGKLLPTIKSRCRQLRVMPLKYSIVTDILQQHFPELTLDETASYAAMSDGSPGYAISLVQCEGLKLYAALLGILSTLPNINVPDAHAFADDVARQKAADTSDRFVILGELILSFISRMIRHMSQVNNGAQSTVTPILTGEAELMEHLGRMIRLDHWATIWEKITNDLNRTDGLNLDRKQIILNIFTHIGHNLK
jgi:DNA polymerase-3 subunit delta'